MRNYKPFTAVNVNERDKSNMAAFHVNVFHSTLNVKYFFRCECGLRHNNNKQIGVRVNKSSRWKPNFPGWHFAKGTGRGEEVELRIINGGAAPERCVLFSKQSFKLWRYIFQWFISPDANKLSWKIIDWLKLRPRDIMRVSAFCHRLIPTSGTCKDKKKASSPKLVNRCCGPSLMN